MKRLFLTILIAVFYLNPVSAKIKLHALLSDHVVLQRETDVNLWGTAKANAKISVKTSWDGKKYDTRSNAKGEWLVKVRTPQAGGPYTIKFSDGEELILNNVLIGEVWICSGQSNMAMRLRGMANQPILNSNDIIMNSNNPSLRLFTVANQTSDVPLDSVSGKWQVSTSETSREFSALAYQYGEMLQKQLNVPVGMIVSSWGGTPVRAWVSQDVIKNFPEALKLKSEKKPQEVSQLYNGMIHPLRNFVARGFLWYQGENDSFVSNTNLYLEMFPAMVNEWRTVWRNQNMPFYYVQIAPWLYNANPTTKRPMAAVMRETQLKSSHIIPNSGMAVTTDIGSNISIHPPDKTTIAKRLLYIALTNTYGKKGITHLGPEYKSMSVKGDQAILEFANTPIGMTISDDCVECFEIAGADKVFYPASAKVSSVSTVTVFSPKVAQPVAVRYAFKNYTKGSLFNTEGLPASSFRTDVWDDL